MSNGTQKITLVTRAEHKKIGKARRQRTPLKSHGQWKPAAVRPDSLVLLVSGLVLHPDISKRAKKNEN